MVGLLAKGLCVKRGSEVIVGTSPLGKAVFASRKFRSGQKVGTLQGRIFQDEGYGSSYCIDFGQNWSFEPDPPFRFLNHSCQPSCELIIWEADDHPKRSRLCLYAVRSIEAGEELTIDYGWSSDAAIPCRCGAPNCRGWIVARDQLADVKPAQMGRKRP
jgi:hypothetical protein